MPEHVRIIGPAAVDLAVLGKELWDAVVQLHVDWLNAARSRDGAAAARAEQELRFFALSYASLEVDGAAVRTGRKAIIRSIYAKLGTRDTVNVLAMIDAVILREEREQAPT